MWYVIVSVVEGCGNCVFEGMMWDNIEIRGLNGVW